MKLIPMLAACVLTVALTATPAAAAIITFNATLSGSQENPANGSTATATATVTVDDVANSVSVVLSFSGLSANAAAAHIHCCVSPSANGPVVIPFTSFPAATSGSYSNTFTGVSAANIAGIEAGLAYVNIHDSNFPGGEIRAQLTPEPAALSLMGLGLAALLGARACRNRGAVR